MEPSDLFMHLAAVLDVRDLAAEGAFYEKLGLRVSPERVDQRQEGCARAGDGVSLRSRQTFQRGRWVEW